MIAVQVPAQIIQSWSWRATISVGLHLAKALDHLTQLITLLNCLNFLCVEGISGLNRAGKLLSFGPQGSGASSPYSAKSEGQNK